MKLTIYGPGMNKGATFHAHKHGCKHGNLPKYARAERLDMEASSRMDVVRKFYGEIASENDDDLSMYESEFHFAPCVTIK